MSFSNRIVDVQQLAACLPDLYNLTHPIQCQFIRRSYNDHFLITAGGQRFILRMYLNHKSYIRHPDDLQFELDLLEFLHQNHMPVAVPIRSLRNMTLNCIGKIGNSQEMRYCALFSYAAGQPLENLTLQQAQILGELIAKLHATACRFRSGYSRIRLDSHNLLLEPFELLKTQAIAFNMNDLSFIEPYVQQCARQLHKLPMNDMTYGLIHGDLNPSNMHYSEEHGFTVFDFDHCSYGWVIHDLAVIRLCHKEDIYNAVLAGYEAVRPLLQEEKGIIPVYSNMLLIKKFKDIFDMRQYLPKEQFSEQAKRELVAGAISVLQSMA